MYIYFELALLYKENSLFLLNSTFSFYFLDFYVSVHAVCI
jgi:hypothetical protein